MTRSPKVLCVFVANLDFLLFSLYVLVSFYAFLLLCSAPEVSVSSCFLHQASQVSLLECLRQMAA